MHFNKIALDRAVIVGSKKVADAFTRLSGAPAESEVSKVEILDLKEAVRRVERPSGESIVAYGQLLTGVDGVSILIITREDALVLVDIMNNQAVGTTGILKDIDRSAIKETLNILSNSYLTAIARETHLTIGLGIPNIITEDRLNDIIKLGVQKNVDKDDNEVAIFESVFVIKEHRVKASLYLIFNKKLVEAMR